MQEVLERDHHDTRTKALEPSFVSQTCIILWNSSVLISALYRANVSRRDKFDILVVPSLTQIKVHYNATSHISILNLHFE